MFINIIQTVLLRIFCHVTFVLCAMYTAYVIYGHALSLLFLVSETQMTTCASFDYNLPVYFTIRKHSWFCASLKSHYNMNHLKLETVMSNGTLLCAQTFNGFPPLYKKNNNRNNKLKHFETLRSRDKNGGGCGSIMCIFV